MARTPRRKRLLGLWTAGWLAVLLLAGLLVAGDVRVQWPVLAVPLLWALVALRPRRGAADRGDDGAGAGAGAGADDGPGFRDESPEDRAARRWPGAPPAAPPPTREAGALPPLPPPGGAPRDGRARG